MIAQLGMYDMASTCAANDRFWAAIRARLGYGPEELNRELPPGEGWLHPGLLLAQTCGYPFRAKLVGRVHLVGTPDYGLEGCPPGYYRSVFLARADDPRDDLSGFGTPRFAYNGTLSQSGWAAPRHHAGRIGLCFGTLMKSGGHTLSARAVLEGRADLAALDALTWKLLQRNHPWTRELKTVGETDPTPALPYICALGQDSAAIFTAVRDALGDLTDADRAALCLRGLVRIPEADYLCVPTPPAPDEM